MIGIVLNGILEVPDRDMGKLLSQTCLTVGIEQVVKGCHLIRTDTHA